MLALSEVVDIEVNVLIFEFPFQSSDYGIRSLSSHSRECRNIVLHNVSSHNVLSTLIMLSLGVGPIPLSVYAVSDVA